MKAWLLKWYHFYRYKAFCFFFECKKVACVLAKIIICPLFTKHPIIYSKPILKMRFRPQRSLKVIY